MNRLVDNLYLVLRFLFICSLIVFAFFMMGNLQNFTADTQFFLLKLTRRGFLVSFSFSFAVLALMFLRLYKHGEFNRIRLLSVFVIIVVSISAYLLLSLVTAVFKGY